MEFEQSLEEWAKDKPLSILQLDPADRAVLRIADERDAIQKKTFTKWVNKHLTKDWKRTQSGKRVGDLFEDLRDGHNLVSLLEVLSGEHLPRERGRMRFHMLQNVQTVLDFLRYRKIKLVNIRAEDIVDGNPKLTLGLIWTIILHFQISDIVVGMEENVSAKDALLKWAQKTTAKYPNVRVDNFTKSWRDGLAFNAIIHRNRPDLIDWRGVQRRGVRERLENAFTVAEQNCSVTRLLDPEDVDTNQPDEKSLITYISSLYDAFPEPSRLHPLYDTDSQKKWEEYREVGSNLYSWTRHHISTMQDRHFSSSLIEMRKMAADMNRFRVEEVPPRAHDKQRLSHLYRDVEKHFRDGEIDRELRLENIERSWQVLMMSHQEKDQAIHDEIKKLEKLQRIAEKLHREGKNIEVRLDDMEGRIEEEARRIDRLHPIDAKHNTEQLERELHVAEDAIKSMFNDAQTLRDARFNQAPELYKMVQHLHQRWGNIRGVLQSRLVSVLSSISVEEKGVSRSSKTVLESRLVDSNHHFRFLQEVTEWVRNKQKQLIDSDYGTDLPSVQAELEKQHKEHRAIEKFQSSVEKCASVKSSFGGEELQVYISYLNGVQKSYSELLLSSKKRASDLESLLDFVQSATNELLWLSEKEEREITRDWSSKNINLSEVEQYYEALMSELEKREIQFNAVQDRGEALVLGHHPASKCIETYMSSMQSQWAWLLQLTLCLEVHLKHVASYQQFYGDVREVEQGIARKEELLNSIFSKADFSLDEGEVLLKDMQDMREELTRVGDAIQVLTAQSRDILPLKQRKTNVGRSMNVTAICSYRQNNQQMVINKDERCVLHDNNQRVRWRITNSSGLEGMVPGVCFLIPPPDKEALEATERIRRAYDRSVTLWQKKQLKMRQNMIFATIKVVRSWDLSQFLAMGASQRDAIRRALNEDAEKLIQEGDPTDPALRRLRREIDEVNRLFDEFERKALDAEKSKNTSKVFSEQVSSLSTELVDVERTLVSRVNAEIPRDVSTLDRLIVEHKEFELQLHSYESRVESVRRTYVSIPQKTSALQQRLDRVVEQWERVWSLSGLYVERLKCVEILISSLTETTTLVSSFELKLSSFDSLPADEDSMRRTTHELATLNASAHEHQMKVDSLIEDTKNVRRLVEKSRTTQKRHRDVERIEDEVHRTTTRWTNVCSQVVERLRSMETTSEFASNYNTSYQTSMNWIDTVDSKSKSLQIVEGGAKRKVNPHMTLYNSVIEEKITIEQVNTMGSRLAKEARRYDEMLETYRDSLEEAHPSLDGVHRARVQTAEEVVLAELDLLNLKYQILVDSLHHQLLQLITIAAQEDPNLKLSISDVPAPSPLRTYRVHLGPLRESTSPLRETRGEDVVDFKTSSAAIILSPPPTLSPKKKSFVTLKNGDGPMGHSNGSASNVLSFTEIRSQKRQEPLTPENVLTAPSIRDPTTGERLTLSQAIGCGLLDVTKGEIVAGGRRINLQEAARLGYVDPTLLHRLVGKTGLVDPRTGKELTLLDAIRDRWFDVTRSTFVDPTTGQILSPVDVAKLGTSVILKNPPVLIDVLRRTSSEVTLDPIKGTVEIRAGEKISIPNAVSQGFVTIRTESEFHLPGCSLTDLLDSDLIEGQGEVLLVKDRFSAKALLVSEACEVGILNPNVSEIFDPQSKARLSLTEALECKLVVGDGWKGREESIPLKIAQHHNLISKPLSLRDAVDMNLVVCEGGTHFILDPLTGSPLRFLEAVEKGVLDPSLKTICHENKQLSLEEAVGLGVVTHSGFIVAPAGDLITLREAAGRGILSSVRRTSIFSIPCVRENATDEFISITAGVEKGLLSPNFVTRTNEPFKLSFQDAVECKILSPQVYPTLSALSGFYENGEELTVLQAVIKEKLLPSGEVYFEEEQNYVPLDMAVELGGLDQEKASFLKGLYNINLTTASVKKTQRHRITVEKKEVRKISFTDALQQGLIDEEEGKLLIPGTNEKMDLEEAISSGTLSLSTEWPELGVISALNREMLKLPQNGWSLEEAIEKKFLDPVDGLMTIPGTDRLVTLKECVYMKFIDPSSASVINPENNVFVHLDRALEKGFLGPTGFYVGGKGEKLQMNQAIKSKLIVFQGEKVELPKPDILSQSLSREMSLIGEEISIEETRGEILLKKLLDGQIKPTCVKVKDPTTGREMNIREAMRKGIVDKHTGQFKVKGRGPMSLDEALKEGFVFDNSPSSSSLEHSSFESSDERTKSERESSTERSIEELDESESGTEMIVISEEVIPIESVVTMTTTVTTTTVVTSKVSRKKLRPGDLVECGGIDPETAAILSDERNFLRGDRRMSLEEAIATGRIKGDSGAIMDPIGQQLLTINEALVKNLLDEDGNINFPLGRPLSVPELKSQGLFDPSDSKVIHPETGDSLTISEALNSEILNPLSSVKHSSLKESVGLAQALNQNIISDETGEVELQEEKVPLLKAVDKGVYEKTAHPLEGIIPPLAISLQAAVKRGLVDLDKGTIRNPATNEETSITKGIEEGKIFVPGKKEQERKIPIKIEQGEIPRSISTEKVQLIEAKEKVVEKVPTKTYCLSPNAQFEYDGAGSLIDKKSKIEIDLGEAAERNLIEKDSIKIHDVKSGKELKLEEIHELQKPSGERMSVKEGIKLGLLAIVGAPVLAGIAAVEGAKIIKKKIEESQREKTPIRGIEIKSQQNKPLVQVEEEESTMSLQTAVCEGKHNNATGLFKFQNETLSLQEAIEKGFIDPNVLTLKDSRSDSYLTLGNAIEAGLVNPKTGLIVDPSGGEINFNKALELGILLSPSRKTSFPEAVYSQQYDPIKNIIKAKDGKEIGLKEAIEKKEVSVDSVLVKQFGSERQVELVPWKIAVNDGSLDEGKGTLVSDLEGSKANLADALENGLLVEYSLPMSLSEVMVKGIAVDGKIIDPKSGKFISLQEALEKNIIDSDSVHVKDTRGGFVKKMALATAIKEGFVSPDDGTLEDFNGGRKLSLKEALDEGLIVDSREPISIQKAIHLGLFNEATGRLTDPNTGKLITVHEGIRRLVLNPDLPAVYNEESSELLSLVESCRRGIIDRQGGTFNSNLSLQEGLESGMLIDIESPLSLYKAIKIGLYENESGKFVHPLTGKKLNVMEGVKEGLIDPNESFVKGPNTQLLKLNEAVKEGILNSTNGTYERSRGKSLTLDTAREQGLILTPERRLSLPQAVSEGLYDPSTGKIGDPLLGQWIDVQAALETKLLDKGKTGIRNPKNQKLKSLRAAIDDGEVNLESGTIIDPKNGKPLTFDRAVEKSLIVGTDKPISFGEAVKEKYIDFRRGVFSDPRTSQTSSLDEAVRHELIDDESAVVRDPQTSHFINLRQAVNSGLVDLKKRALVDDGKLKELCIIFEQGSVVFLRDPMSFHTAIEKGMLDLSTALFSDPTLADEPISLKEALNIHAIDPNSAVVKDTLKKCFVPLGESYSLALIDPEGGTVLDTASNIVMSLEKALDEGLVLKKAGSIGLLEALDFSLYSPQSGKLRDPFEGKEMSLAEGLRKGVFEGNTTVVKEIGTGRLLPLSKAIEEGIVEAENGWVKVGESRMNFLEASKKGILLPAEARLATEAQYRQCDASISNLTDWLNNVEGRLAHQEHLKETVEEIRKQTLIVKAIRDDVEDKSQHVSTTLDQVRHLVATGGDVLSAEEIGTLEKNGRTLKTRFDRVQSHSEKLYRKLLSSSDELKKYKTEVSTFKTWMEKAIRTLEDREKNISNLSTSGRDNTKEFVSDVMAHQGDLRFITMSAQKFMDDSRDYLQTLNEFRTNLADRLPFLEARESSIKGEVKDLTNTYSDLLNRANKLLDKLSNLGSKQKDFQDALNKAMGWLQELQPRAQKILSEPPAADTRGIEEQLAKTKSLQNEVLSNGRLIDAVRLAANNLLKGDDLSPAERNAVEGTTQELEKKYQGFLDALATRVSDLDAALVQTQGVQDAVDSVSNWLTSAENQLKSIFKPASLIRERLDEQLREVKLLQADIDSHRPSIESMARAADELLRSGGGRLSQRTESKLKDVLSRYEKLVEKLLQRSVHLNDVSASLDSFMLSTSHFDQWFSDMYDLIESKVVGDGAANVLEEIMRRKEERKKDFDEMLAAGRALLAKRDITDTAHVKDKIKALENQWRDLTGVLDEKYKHFKIRLEQMNNYDKLREQVLAWLNNMERRIESLKPVALDSEVIRQQSEELRPLIKEHRDYAQTIEKLNDLGTAVESLVRSESPRRRGPTPTKKPSIRSSDHRSPSPTKTFGGTTPLSPGSSGFGSRRGSGDGILEDSSPVQSQLHDINNRYNLIGMKLNDRQSEIDSLRDEIKKIQENLKMLNQALEKEERAFPKDSVPHSKDEANKLLRAVKNILENLMDRQGLLDSTKTHISDILRRKPNVAGSAELQNEFERLNSRWKELQDKCKGRISFLETVKDFHENHDNLSSWLGAKEKMMSVLGPIASDPRMVQNQMEQVHVMRDEFRAQKPILDAFNNNGDTILSSSPAQASPDSSRKVEEKLSNVNEKWNDLLTRLDDREGNLDAAAGASHDFYNSLNKLQDNLHKISDDLDDLIADKEKLDPEELLKRISGIERNLEAQRPLLADVEAAGEALCRILNDPAAKADIKQKLAQVGRLYNQCQKKLDNCKAELENSKREVVDFNNSCEAAAEWLADQLNQLSDKFLVSADRDELRRQVDEFEPTYRGILSKEHEIIMILNKGKDLLSKLTRKADHRPIQTAIEKVTKAWEKLKQEASNRHSRLQTATEHCRKYDRARDSFINWLEGAEKKCDNLKLSQFKKPDIDKALKDLSALKNDIWRHTGDYETTRNLGETFLAATDKDKEGVKAELEDLKERWEGLNSDIHKRTLDLEEAAAKLGEFTDSCRDVKNALGSCEDKLASHDSLGEAGKDPKFLQRIKGLLDEAKKLEKPLENVRAQGDDLCNRAHGHNCDSQHIQDAVDDLTDRFDTLKAKLGDRASDLESAKEAMARFNEDVKAILSDLSDLDKELNGMKPPGRDIPTVKGQIREMEAFSQKLSKRKEDVARAAHAAEDLIKKGFASDVKSTKDTISNMQKQVLNLDKKARSREEDLDKTLARLEAFYHLLHNTDEEIDELVDAERKFGGRAVGGDVESIRATQAQFKEFRAKYVEAVGKSVDECNKNGQGLIQSAHQGVSTSILEKDLEKLNEKWNALKERINEQERKLDGALLQSGKFQEALAGLDKWLSDIEEMVANQKPPSADFKVVKAQLQEQKFLNKMLADRQPSVASLFKMGREIAASAEPAERAHIEGQMADLGGRYDNLCEGAKERQKALEDAMRVAKEFQDKLGPLSEWLDKTGKKLKDMSLVPTDEDKIQKRIREHDALHDSILRKQPDFNELADIASALMDLVGDDEAAMVADKLQDATDKYGRLVEESEALGALLKGSKAALRHLVLSYEELVAWMDSMEKRLNKYKVVSVHKDKLLEQMDQLVNLTEEIKDHEKPVDETVDAGLDLMKSISNEEAIQLKDKLDSLQRRFQDISSKAGELLKNSQDALPLVSQFHAAHETLSEWLLDTEGVLQSLDSANLSVQEKEITRLEHEIPEQRKFLDIINLIGPQLCQLSPGEGASTIEGLVTRDNRRFDAICEQVQRRAERIQMAKSRSMEVLSDLDDLLDWFRDIEGQLKEAEKPSCEPDIVRVQLQEHRALNDEITSQKVRVRDVLATAKKVLREGSHGEDTAIIREKADDLRETMEVVTKLSSDRLNALEQALPLAQHFFETHIDLNQWMDAMEEEIQVLDAPALRPDQVMKLQEKTQVFVTAVNEHRPLLEKLNKTGGALVKLCNEDDGGKVEDIMAHDNERFNALRTMLKEKQQALDKALHDSSQFKDKLDGMLNALESTAEQVNNAEPISAHPDKIREQMDENNGIIDDMKKREDAFNSVKKQAAEVISRAANKSDPAVIDIKNKLDRLNSLWDQIQKATKTRGKNLDEALALAEKFWAELQAIMEKLDALKDTLKSQEPPAVEPKAIQKQQDVLKEIKRDMDKTKPEVTACRQTGQNLMKICGDQDKPEVKKNIEDLDREWDNITALFAKREENLIDAMEKAMEFHDTLQALIKFLDRSEERLGNFGIIGTDIDAVKKQIKELKDFKSDVDPMMVKVEALNRQAAELTERTSPDQAQKIKGPLGNVNRRWDDLLKGIVERQRELENALLRLGQFQHALNELMAWMERTNKNLDTLKPVFGDPQVIEVELSKLKVLSNDIAAHQSSVDTLNDAGRQIIETEKGTDDASKTAQKLVDLNKKWKALQEKANGKQKELEDALREAVAFNGEIQDLLHWLADIDGALSTSKPVGGLPETAAEQLSRFMEIYNEIEANKAKVEGVLQQGAEYLKRSTEGAATNLQHNLRTLKQRWDSVLNRANDKKIKLEIALKEANEFHAAVQEFIDWLTEAERYFANIEPVSRVLDRVLDQVEAHKDFQKQVSAHRESMLNLEKKGNHLKYFSQKQDVILIKNLLISVQHRWDRVVSKSTERTRALDLGLKEAKEFHDGWFSLCKWLDEAEKSLDDLTAAAGNNPAKIKALLQKHKEFQRTLAAKQPQYDHIMKVGKALKEKAPKVDEPILRQMLTDLKNKWNAVCNKSVERQRGLEEALLRSGQFKDALQELLDWLKTIDGLLVDDSPVHGDLDTVLALIEQHKKVEEELHKRRAQMDDIIRTAEEMMETAPPDEKQKLQAQIRDVKSSFDKVKAKCESRSRRLEQALKEAEKLHKAVHMLLEWLSDAEMRLRFSGTLPEDEESSRKLLEDHEKFMKELLIKEREKDDTIELAKSILAKAHPDAINVIKHWISIIQSRWDEISSWAKQRQTKLQAHLNSLRDMEDLLEELMNWLRRCEDTLSVLEAEPLPDDLGIIQNLIKEHKEFMEGMAKRQPEIDSVCKPKMMSRQSVGPTRGKIGTRLRSATPGNESREGSPDLDFAQRRLSPGREKTPDMFGHIGPRFDRRGSKAVEPQIKNPKVKALWDKWKHVWMMAWERQRRLQDKYNYLLELEKVKNFSWEDWRKRFLKFMNHKKSRVTDLFRKIDRNNNGLIPREEFIDAIMKTKFPTSRLEMNAVADMFDHGDHLIDYMEFIAALRPDWEEKKPSTEADIVDDEIQRQVMKCTCRQKFRVFQVGEGKYRFGDSQKLRLVRILRSTVMVRVGGGWVALDEFLVKNDPCRVVIHLMSDMIAPMEHELTCPSYGSPCHSRSCSSKGRTNIELREQFILADGVSQSMTAFKSKASGSSMSSGPRSAHSLPAAGPITKVKEKSIRSVPMGSTRARSTDRTTPDSTFSDDGFASRYSRKSSAGPGRSSQPGSRTGSKPPSRAGSQASLDSEEGSRIPVRRSTSLKRGSSGGFSSRPLASSTPTRPSFSLNTNVNGGSGASRGMSPGPSTERARSFIKPPSGIQRTGSASSLSSLNNSGSRPSRIPVFVGGGGDESGSLPRSRTPSNSNIPVAVAQQSPGRATTPSGNVTFSTSTTEGPGRTTTTTTTTTKSSEYSSK